MSRCRKILNKVLESNLDDLKKNKPKFFKNIPKDIKKINSVSTVKLNGGEVLFIDTPNQGYFLDKSGVIGNEDDGFTNSKFKKYNSEIVDLLMHAKKII